jgi:hypothetical protein
MGEAVKKMIDVSQRMRRINSQGVELEGINPGIKRNLEPGEIRFEML